MEICPGLALGAMIVAQSNEMDQGSSITLGTELQDQAQAEVQRVTVIRQSVHRQVRVYRQPRLHLEVG